MWLLVTAFYLLGRLEVPKTQQNQGFQRLHFDRECKSPDRECKSPDRECKSPDSVCGLFYIYDTTCIKDISCILDIADICDIEGNAAPTKDTAQPSFCGFLPAFRLFSLDDDHRIGSFFLRFPADPYLRFTQRLNGRYCPGDF